MLETVLTLLKRLCCFQHIQCSWGQHIVCHLSTQHALIAAGDINMPITHLPRVVERSDKTKLTTFLRVQGADEAVWQIRPFLTMMTRGWRSISLVGIKGLGSGATSGHPKLSEHDGLTSGLL